MNDYRILYAEDEPSNRKVLEISLARRGMRVDLASNGTDALRLFRENEYDLVILDWYMPGMNGDELARAIRKENTEIALVAITSDDLGPDILVQCGFDDVFVKPLIGTRYVDRIIELIEQKSTDRFVGGG